MYSLRVLLCPPPLASASALLFFSARSLVAVVSGGSGGGIAVGAWSRLCLGPPPPPCCPTPAPHGTRPVLAANQGHRMSFFWYTRTVFLLYCRFCAVYRDNSGTAVPKQISEPALAAVLVRVYKRETQQMGSSHFNPWCSAWLQCVAAPLLGRAHVGARGCERCAMCARWGSVKCVAPRA